MVTTLIVIVVVLLLAAGVIGYLVERGRQQSVIVPRPRHVIDLRTLPPTRVHDYRADWAAAQARFVDDPDGAVQAADTLVERLMAERGYPPADDDLDPADLATEQAEVMHHYQAAHEIATDDSDVDADVLRRAMVHYRMAVSALLESAAKQHAE